MLEVKFEAGFLQMIVVDAVDVPVLFLLKDCSMTVTNLFLKVSQ